MAFPVKSVTAVELIKLSAARSAALFLVRLPDGSLVVGRLWVALAVGGGIGVDEVKGEDGDASSACSVVSSIGVGIGSGFALPA
jgi:hypothetical protein